MRYTLEQPLPAKKSTKDGRVITPEITEVELRYPRAKSLVEMSKAGAFADELQTAVGLAKAIVVDPGLAGFSVEDFWIGDIKNIVEAGEKEGFFPSETRDQKTALELMQERIEELESRIQALEGSSA